MTGWGQRARSGVRPKVREQALYRPCFLDAHVTVLSSCPNCTRGGEHPWALGVPPRGGPVCPGFCRLRSRQGRNPLRFPMWDSFGGRRASF